MDNYSVGGVRLARPFKIRRLGHAGFNVGSLDTMIAFYHEVLGLRISDIYDIKSTPGLPPHFHALEDSRIAFLNLGSDHHSVVLIPNGLNEALGQARPELSINQIAWQVNSLTEVAEGGNYLAQAGLQLSRVGRDSPGSNWHVYFYAPDGHLNELFYGIEQIGWDGKSKPRPMPVGHFGEIALPRPTERAEVEEAIARGIDIGSGSRMTPPKNGDFDLGGVLVDQPFKIVKTGPMRLFVDQLDETVEFYRDRLGLEITEEVAYEGLRCVFLRAGSEHHTVALYPLELRARLGLNPNSRTMSFGMQVGSYAQLRDARAFLQERGYTLVDIPHALTPGIDYAVNVLDPEGNCIQLYYYMEQIGWDGKPRPSDQRAAPDPSWPVSIEAQSDSYADAPFFGPID